jgi:Protein of unknown function (DUF1553)/Protein of unknown function (DUF1549)
MDACPVPVFFVRAGCSLGLLLALTLGSWAAPVRVSAAEARLDLRNTTNHWAFRAPASPPAPKVRRRGWVRSPIDAFILARLEAERIAPSPEADPMTLLRRVTLDLTGLPPTPDEADRYRSDADPNRYERLVDRLLASPHFGERWGRHWLDLARYADSSGYQVDRERPWAWMYRDWVVRSVNQDQPFDQFSVWQLAGDLAAPALPAELRRDAVAASGFHRMTLSNHEDGVDAAEFAVRAKVDRVATTGSAWLGLTLGCAECHSHKYDPIDQREFYQLYAFFDRDEEDDRTAADQTVLYTFKPAANPGPTRVHVRGDFLRPGDEVAPGFLECLGGKAAAAPANRLDLARWIASENNPLTARVAVNQVWMHLFGRGLVSTPEDFGVRGERPSHPELLDWLAREFIRGGWSRKALIREIVLSAAYRQSSNWRPDLADRDPENRWLARQNRLRLEAEALRDGALAVSGLLNPQIGGKSFRPHLPEDVQWLSTASAWSWTDDTGPTVYRRSLYMYAQRTVPHPLLPTFDLADASACTVRRERSDTPLQALSLLNNPQFVECARALAARIVAEAPGRPAEQARLAFTRCTGREPSPAEARRLDRLALGLQAAAPASAPLVLAQTALNLDEFLNRE